MTAAVGAVRVVEHAGDVYDPGVLHYDEVVLGPLAEGLVRVRTVYLSLDPSNRNWLRAGTVRRIGGVEIALRPGDVMIGHSIGVVEQSRLDGYREGDIVTVLGPWQEVLDAPAIAVRRLSPSSHEPLTAYLSVFSHVGMAALTGMRDVLAVAPGQTVVVSGAAGATGSLAVEIARDAGARVVAIAGGPDKCAAVLALGADAAVDYRSPGFEDDLADALADGASGFFDNVGGATLDAVLPHIAMFGTIALCGVMADYEAAGGARYGNRNLYHVLMKAIRLQGFLAERTGRPRQQQIDELRGLFARGVIHDRTHLVAGLANAPEYLGMLFAGRNRGKLVVEVSSPPEMAV
ncbi:NADP-dependent oxidoreductase [soil metagenome]